MELKFDRVVIAGAGGVGYWLTIALCRELGGKIPIEVYDPDTFKGGNGFRRLPKTMDASKYKVEMLRMHVSFFMGDSLPTVYADYLDPAKFLKGDWTKTLVLDCTDMHQLAREELWDSLQKAGAKGIRISYDGLGIQTISPGPPLMAGGATDGGYQLIPNLPQSFGAAGLGAQAALYALYTGEILEFQVHVPTPTVHDILVRPSNEVDNYKEEDFSNVNLHLDNSQMPNSLPF